jgi:hypothetical protein
LSRNPQVKLLGTSTFVSNSLGLINEVFYYPQSDEEIKRALPFLNPFVHGSVMIDRKLLLACGGYNEKYPYVQDYELWSRLVYETKVANLTTPLYARMRYRSCSEVAVDKEKIVGQIQEKLLQRKLGLCKAPEPSEYPIRAKSLYPVISRPFPQARLLAEHFLKMFEQGKEFSTPYWSNFLKGMFYCPSACIVKWLRMRRREHAAHSFFSHQ